MRRAWALSLLMVAGCWTLQLPDAEVPAGNEPAIPLAVAVVPSSAPAQGPPPSPLGIEVRPHAELLRLLDEAGVFAKAVPLEGFADTSALSARIVKAGGSALTTCHIASAAGLLPFLTVGVIPAKGTMARGWIVELQARSGARLTVDASFASVCWMGWLPALANALPGWTFSAAPIHAHERERLAAALLARRGEIEALARAHGSAQ
jgi:hypothetical protein